MANAPGRPALKRTIRIFRDASDWRAITILCFDLLVFLAAAGAVVVAESMIWKSIAGVLMGLQIARLFIIGHDACHQCFVSNRDWNRRIGWLAFLPSLTTYSLWEAGHNLGHHVFTNLRGRDYVWTPLSKAEYDAMSPARRLMERFYRSGFGYGAYYLVELWWKKLFFPSELEMPGRKPVHRRDSLIVAAFALAWISGLAGLAVVTKQSILLLIGMGFVWPLIVWSLLMGAVIYFHHTHPDLRWYEDPIQWEADRDGVSTTVHVTLPGRLGWLLNNIMTHPAHHLDVRIPFYRIEAAQRALSDAPVLEQPLTLRYMVDTTRRCKLYDYDDQRWMDFSGRYTTAAMAHDG
jgi:omega-6 fatty acid desaturase (delta-12 desaturase)